MKKKRLFFGGGGDEILWDLVESRLAQQPPVAAFMMALSGPKCRRFARDYNLSNAWKVISVQSYLHFRPQQMFVSHAVKIAYFWHVTEIVACTAQEIRRADRIQQRPLGYNYIKS